MSIVKHTTDVVDEDGVLLKSIVTTQSTKISTEPNYVKVYLDDILTITGLSNSHGGVLFALIKEMNYKNLIHISGSMRKEIAEELGIAPITLTKALEKFIKEGIFARKERGVYFVNPYLFGKGAWKDIKSIRLTVDYVKGKKTIKSSINFTEHVEDIVG